MECRPCIVTEITDDDRTIEHEALFHQWIEIAQFCYRALDCGIIYKDYPRNNENLVAIVEYEDGTIHGHFSDEIKFTDGMVKKFCKKQAETVIGTNERYENAKK